ncbi:MAG: serpin family protein [Cyanobacteria bacterium J06635_13]
MNRNTVWGTLAVVLLLFLAGIAHQEEASSIVSLDEISAPSQLVAQKTEVKMSQLVDANNRFGFDLFTQLQPDSASANLVVSPQSIAIALAMLRNGAAAETRQEIISTLKLEQFDSEGIDSSYRQLIETLTTADNDLQLAIANSLWANQNVLLADQFVDQTQNFYQGKISNLDFGEPAAKNTINEWVASNTAHKIPQIVEQTSPEDVLYLINAIYFKGSWTDKFDPQATADQPFYPQPDLPKSVAMMSQTGDYRYYENEQFQAVRLPYGEKSEMGMYIFLPQPDSTLEQFNQELSLDNWQEWLSQMRSQPGNISLPKFNLEYETELQNILSALGMPQVFDPTQADFSAMTDSAVAVDTIKHKAVIEVNEEGSEAAGVTSIGVRITSAMPQDQPFNMNMDRPFFFAIRDDITETILFMGNLVEP